MKIFLISFFLYDFFRKLRQQRRQEEYLKEREEGFDLNFSSSKSSESPYNALLDKNMKPYFDSRQKQRHLMKIGLIDTHGRVIPEKTESKLRILENEFARAERVEREIQKEEEEAREFVRKRRLKEVEELMKQEFKQKLKSNQSLTNEVNHVLNRFF